MLIVNNRFNNLCSIFNETKDSDSFEKKCARYLRKQFPNHKFTVKGGNNKMFSDILVDDSFYIECKMTERNHKSVGVQSTGFGIELVEDGDKRLFECSDTVGDSESAKTLIDYINSNIDKFSKLVSQHTSKIPIEVDQSVSSDWIHNFYLNKNVKYFMAFRNGKFSIFKNTIENLLKYFNITAYARYYSNGTKNVPNSQRDIAIDFIKSNCKVDSVTQDDKKTIVKLKSTPENLYYDISDDLRIFLSDKNMPDNEYRVMKVSKIGSPRILFYLNIKSDQDSKDFYEFKSFIDK